MHLRALLVLEEHWQGTAEGLKKFNKNIITALSDPLGSSLFNYLKKKVISYRIFNN